jgi:hypothetical protein
MDIININFSRTHKEIERAHLAFSNATPRGKLFRRFGYLIAATISMIVLFYLSKGSMAEFTIQGLRQPRLENIATACLIVPLSLVGGFFLYFSVNLFRNANALRGISRLPTEFFGDATAILDESGIAIHAPMLQVKYDWRLLDSVLITPEFVFICSGQGIRQTLAAWIPIEALGDYHLNAINQIEKWLAKP